jgi:hypothetical protein
VSSGCSDLINQYPVGEGIGKRREGTEMPERLTRKNGSGTYRVPMATQGELDLKWQQGELNVFGELANRLGQYEDLGTVKELTELKNRIKK